MVDTKEVIERGFPKEVVEECFKDQKCKKGLMEKYVQSFAIEQEGKELGRVADECMKDEKCKTQAKNKYVSYLSARSSKQTLEAIDKGVSIGYTIAKAVFVILILYALFQFIWWLVTGFPPFIQELVDQIASALENAIPDFPSTTTFP